MTDSLTPSAYTPPVADGLRAVERWLDDREDTAAAECGAALARIVGDALDGFLATVEPETLTAAADFTPLAAIGPGWRDFVQMWFGEHIAGMHLAGGLTAWIGAESAGQLLPRSLVEEWPKVANFMAQDYVRKASNRLVGLGDDVWQQVSDRVQTSLFTGSGIDKLRQRIGQITAMSQRRAETIARTETIGAYVNGDRQGAEALGQYGPLEHVWYATRDSRTRPTHKRAHNQCRPFKEPFEVGSHRMMHPHDRAGGPEEIVNCRCVELHLYAGDERPDGSIVEAPPAKPKTGAKLDDLVAASKTAEMLEANPKLTAAGLQRALREQGYAMSNERARRLVQEARTAKLATRGGPTGVVGAPSRADVEWMSKNDHPITRKPSSTERTPESAVSFYTGSGYQQINSALRSTGSHQITDNLDRALQPPQKPFEVYRGTSLLRHLPEGTTIEDLQGSVIHDRAYLSASAGAGRGPAFGGDTAFRITVNENSRGAYVQPISRHSSEREYVIARDQPMHVRTVRKPRTREEGGAAWESKYRWIVEVETVSPDWVTTQTTHKVWDTNRRVWR